MQAWRSRLYLRTAVLTLLVTFLSLSLIGYLLFWQVSNLLEKQFGENLRNLSFFITESVEPAHLQLIRTMGKRSRSYRTERFNLIKLKEKAGLRRIFIFNENWQSLLDTDSTYFTEQKYFDLYLDQRELSELQSDSVVISDMYEDKAGVFFKRAYTKIISGEDSYFIGIEAGNRFLSSYKNMKRIYVLFSGMIVVFVFFISYFFARTISEPVKKLAQSTREIQQGNLKKEIRLNMDDEIGSLARSMEKMRQSILRKELQQEIVLAGIAHEIRNPLGGIEMFAGIIAEEAENRSIKDQANKILKESHQIQKILREFNDFGKPAKRSEQEINLNEFVHEIVELMQKDLAKKDVRLQLKIDNREMRIHFDPGHLRQILLNLLRNSLQFSRSGGIIRLNVQENKKKQVCLDLMDGGPGIPEDQKEQIFEPFYSSLKDHTGLGLAIVKNLMEENGAVLRLMEAENGAWFRLIFPGISNSQVELAI